jgi:hypothetical protein
LSKSGKKWAKSGQKVGKKKLDKILKRVGGGEEEGDL